MAASSLPADPVPLAVWPCGQDASGSTTVDAALARRIIDEYSRPGDRVVAPAAATVVAREAVDLGRRFSRLGTPRRGRAQLAVITEHGAGPSRRALYAECHQVLSPCGILAVVAQQRRRGGRAIDCAAGTVGGAQRSGFAYVQHVIALACAIRDHELVAPSGPPARALGGKPGVASRASLIAHRDVLVFVREDADG